MDIFYTEEIKRKHKIAKLLKKLGNEDLYNHYLKQATELALKLYKTKNDK